VQAGLGVAAGPRASSSSDSAAGGRSETAKVEMPAAPPAPPPPPPVITKGDGAQSVEAVVKQMQSAAQAGKGAQVLSVIYPSDRPTYAQGVTMALAFLPMSALGNEKEADRLTKELDAFFAKHQIKPPFSKDPAELFKGVDLAAYLTDVMVFMKSHAKKGDNPADALPVPSGRPENVKISGDDAVATMSGKEVKFAKVSNRWFIRLE
jgi:hypothetical protein